MKKITYPFDLRGQISVHFKSDIHPIFFETHDNFTDIALSQFAVKAFSYDAEHQLFSVSLQKAINTADMGDIESELDGLELESNIIKLDMQYCLSNACILSSKIAYPLASEDSFIDSIKVTKPLTLELA